MPPSVESNVTASVSGLGSGERPDPCVVVLFGASGDLGRRELVPALFELWKKELLPERFAILGVARSAWSDEDYRERMRRAVEEFCPVGCEGFESFAPRLHYLKADVGDAGAYGALASRLEELREEHGVPDHTLYHLALPPSFFDDVVSGLEASGLARPDAGWARLVVEKPFGSDLDSARALDRRIRSAFEEDRTYRIDHFLGKETVQNMLVFRFANPAFEPIWNRNYIDHVQITVAETLGIGSRGAFYEETGVLRDMVQNHLLQLLCMTALEPPVAFDARSLRDETVKVLQAVNVEPVDLDAGIVAGQYGAGDVDGEEVAAYRAEADVAPDSLTPTFAALRLTVDSWRWAGVPFYLRTGKRMARKATEVVVHFRPTPHHMFPAEDGGPLHASLLAFRLQPEEGIVQTFVAKRPGPDVVLEPVRMRFSYEDAFGVEHPPRAYAWLLHDVMMGNQTLFARSDWIEEAWKVVDPVIARSEEGRGALRTYASGSWGPEEAEDLLARDGRRWTLL